MDRTDYENLQEFKDPELYDLENQWAKDDDFFLEMAKEIGGPILDIACGTGRLTRKLSEAGLEVIGLDIVPEMLGRARLLDENQSIKWIEADCRTFQLKERFNLILMTSHGFQNLLTDEDQNAFFRRAYEHLNPGGMLLFDLRTLENKNYGNNSDYTYLKSIYNKMKDKIDIYLASEYNPNDKLDKIKKRRVIEAKGIQEDTEILLRYTNPKALNKTLMDNGFEIVQQYGDWDKSALGPESSEIITVCKKK